MAREYETNPRGHTWKRDDDGTLDIFAFEVGTCNGPECVTCGYSFCHHCTNGKATQDCTAPSQRGEQ